MFYIKVKGKNVEKARKIIVSRIHGDGRKSAQCTRSGRRRNRAASGHSRPFGSSPGYGEASSPTIAGIAGVWYRFSRFGAGSEGSSHVDQIARGANQARAWGWKSAAVHECKPCKVSLSWLWPVLVGKIIQIPTVLSSSSWNFRLANRKGCLQ